MTRLTTVLITAITTILAIAILVIAFAWSGLYPVGAGSSHYAPIGWLLETTRARSVAVRASDLVVPEDIDTLERIAAGAGHYKDMCAGCHGAPGTEPAESFNPAPPALYRHPIEPREAFWTIKHGLRMTAMPSHLDHSDTDNWDTVAFVRALPDMSAEEYTGLTEEATHGHADGEEHDHGSMASGQSASSTADARANDDSASHEHGSDTSHEHADAAGEDPSPRQTDGQSAPAKGGADHDHGEGPTTPEGTLEAFHHALAEGRGDDALAYLHPRAVITEGGRVETVEHYANGHMAGDMEFLGQISVELISREVLAKSDTQTTISSQRRMRGQVGDQTIDLAGSETATLVKTDAGWQILHLAWSSRPYTGG